jgi:hypothetical protein
VRAFENDTNPPDAGVLAIFQSLGKMNTNEASATKGKEEASTSKAMAIKSKEVSATSFGQSHMSKVVVGV